MRKIFAIATLCLFATTFVGCGSGGDGTVVEPNEDTGLETGEQNDYEEYMKNQGNQSSRQSAPKP